MKTLTAVLSSLVILFASVVVHGDEGMNDKMPQKVTNATMSGSQDEHEAGAMSEQTATTQKDLETIRQEESSSAVFIAIKVLALAASIAGLGLVYLTRRRSQGGPK